MKTPIKTLAFATLALFALSGCDFSSNTDNDSPAVRDDLSSKQGEDNGGTSVKPPIGGGDPMPPPEYYVPPSKPEEPTPPANYESDTTKYVKEPEKEPPQQQPIDPTKIVTWSKEVDKWIMSQHQIDPKEQEQREVWILEADTGSIRAKIVLTADGVRRLEGGFYVIFPEEYNS